ncbi:nucleoside triphosphate pyrophosphohydrolase [Rhodoligotrophos defluvii]|uniref:nucleoside triphosphate pyrophosphohydrolase n=1 Tax=Rhodoligotrophos defluvii TaxID=2561934 RepID=UPI0010C993AA|nr:nucleoside triphosphate pyrophosphohydrolase [Rhodoligotrophos defluvii]
MTSDSPAQDPEEPRQADVAAADAGPLGDPKSIDTLLAIMAALRDPESGCPWDLQQSFATIAPYTIEEAYEVADAIARGDLGDLRDELGDLQLQVVYHAQLAAETGAFTFADVIEAITSKMIRRHPHVFGDAAARARGATPGMWERIKADEREAKAAAGPAAGEPGRAGAASAPSLLDDVPQALPALSRAAKLQNRAARVGFDWPSLEPVLDKAAEELGELRDVLENGGGRSDMAEEIGDLLFVIANVARHLKIDPEDALRSANAKFVRRFRYIEQTLEARGETPEAAGLAGMDALWDEAKARGL